ncbi:hypothetical protein BDDG_09962, partial [Blastomyces dermatitidis ATCC 18188]
FSHINRSAFTDNSKVNVKLLIENLKNTIMKKLSVLYIIRSFISLSTSSTACFSATLSQSSILISISDSSALTISVSIILTFTTSDFTVSAFIINSSHFKKMLYRLNKSYLLRIISLLNSIEI